MNFNEHSEFRDLHAFLSPSQYHWLNYDTDKLKDRYSSFRAKERGTELHALAEQCIRLGIKLARTKATLNMFVNDAVGYKMTPEQPLVYSRNCFGTADAISFRKGVLRVHDLKTGTVPANMAQLRIYAALFCLEYGYNPDDIEFSLRIYQSNDILEELTDPEEIKSVMQTIVHHDQVLEELQQQ